MRVQDVMSKKVTTVTPQTTAAAARELLRTEQINHLVVLDANKQLAGIVTGMDIARAADDAPLSQVMSHPVVTIDPEATIRRAAGILRGRGIGCLPVLAAGRLAGIVTTSDLLTGISKGEIHAAPPSERIVLRKRGARSQRRLP